MCAGMLPCVTEQRSLSHNVYIVSVGGVNEFISEDRDCDRVERSSLYAPE
jgi:hypothetical protein